MEYSDIIIAHPDSQDKLVALTEFMNVHHISFELALIDSPYKKEFVERIIQGDEDKNNGRGRKISIDEFEQLWK